MTKIPGPPMKTDRARVTFNTTPAVLEHLETLVETGLYGRNYHEAAERLVCEALRRRIEDDETEELS